MASHFEGIEKRIEFKFNLSNGSSLFSIPIEEIKAKVLKRIACAVLDDIYNDHVHAYLLSESSMFVFKDRIMLKTCGLTTLLSGVVPLLDLIADYVDVESVEYVLYSRRSFIFPTEQLTPHRSWEEEVDVMTQLFPDGVTAVSGMGDQFHVFLADRRPEGSKSEINFMEVAMRKLDTEVMKKFWKPEDFVSHEKSMEESGVQTIMNKDCLHNGFMFTPCGFSSNSIVDQSYYTIHITPEDSFSYVSYETNARDFREEIYENVQDYFNPGEYSMTVIADNELLENFEFETVQITPRVAMSYQKNIAAHCG